MDPRCEGVARFAVATSPQVERPYLESNCELFQNSQSPVLLLGYFRRYYWCSPNGTNVELWYCGRFILRYKIPTFAVGTVGQGFPNQIEDNGE